MARPNLYTVNGEKFVADGSDLFRVVGHANHPVTDHACLWQGRVVGFQGLIGPDVPEGMFVAILHGEPGTMPQEREVHVSDVDSVTKLEYVDEGDLGDLPGGELGQVVAEMVAHQNEPSPIASKSGDS